MLQKFLCLIIIQTLTFSGYSQNIHSLNIGDTIPNFQIGKFLNSPESNVSIKDYKGKLVILDFWNKGCHSCLEAFPKMEKLQQEFPSTIKILLVTNDKKEDVEKLFKRVKAPLLPIITDDTILTNMFPHLSVPHHVWINKDGIVKFITDGYNATKSNIKKVLDDSAISLNIRREVNDFDRSMPIWEEGNGRLKKYIDFYSIGTKRIKENAQTRWGMSKDTINYSMGFKFFNVPLLNLYKMAFGYSIYKSEFKHNNRINFNLPDSGFRFNRPVNSDSLSKWLDNYLVCYESKWDIFNDSAAFQFLQGDLNRFFPYSVRIEEKKVLCYTLELVNPKINLVAGGNPSISTRGENIYIKNVSISGMVESLNSLEIFKKSPLIDYTHNKGKVDLVLKDSKSDIKNLKKQLLIYGFKLKENYEIINMLTISEK